MCGIIGSNKNRLIALEAAAELFRYRGPDATVFFADEHATLGHHRLSVIDTGTVANQPMWDEERTTALIFNGELYNFKELRSQLAHKYPFRTASDTEVFLYAYKEWGVECVQRFRGMFAAAIYDTQKQRLVLFRDHAGIKPVYYAHAQGTFAFSSELKGLTRFLREAGIGLERDESALELYSVFGYIPSPHTLYRETRKLEKSSWLEFDLCRPNQPPVIKTYSLDTPDIKQTEEFERIIERSIQDHLVADVPIGVFFSGGTDSSLIVERLHARGMDLKTFSVRLDGKTEDARFFTAISERLGLTPKIYDFGTPEFNEVYGTIMDRIDEPLSDNSLFPTYFISAKAAKEVTVVLSGEGGDELFLGYPRHLALRKFRRAGDGMTWLDKTYVRSPTFPGKNKLFEHAFLWAKQPVSYYLIHMSPTKDLVTETAWLKAKEFVLSRCVDPVSFDRELYLENALLKKLDMATSYASIEGRVPLLDGELYKAGGHFIDRHLEGGVLKAVLKKILAKHLPPELVYRKKSGFGMDMRRYFRSSTRLMNDLLAASRCLDDENILPNRVHANPEIYIERYPNYCLSLVTLYHAIKNTGGLNAKLRP